MIRLRRWLVALALVLPIAAVGVPVSAAATAATGPYGVLSWGTNGRVTVIASAGDRVYIGGTFTAVTDPTGNTYPAQNVAVYIPSTGAFDTTFQAGADGAVNALAIAGGELYMGGAFSNVDGVPRAHLAAVNTADGTLTSWAPVTNNPVNALLSANGAIYAGGSFTQITDSAGLHAIPFVAKLDPTDATVATNWVLNPSDNVDALAASTDGTQIFVGGDFVAIDGISKFGHLVAVNANTGALAWTTPVAYGAPSQSRPQVIGLAVDGSNLLIAGGGGGGTCAAVVAGSGSLLWTQHTNGDVQGVAASDGVVYCGGHFEGTASFAGQTRSKLALVTEATGAVLPFAPTVNSALGIWSMGSSTNSDSIFIGGDFTKVAVTGGWGVKAQFFIQLLPTAPVLPGPPENVIARPGDSVVRLSWDQPWTNGASTVFSYRIYRGAPGGTMKKIGSSTTTAYADTTAVDGTTYAYAVQAANTPGVSVMSPTLTATPAVGAAQVPTNPRLLTAVAATSGAPSVALSWTAPVDNGGQPITSYTILRGTSSGGETAYDSVPGTATTYTDLNTAVNTPYYYEVVAVNSVGASPASSEASATVTATVPGKPVLTAKYISGTVVLNWNAPTQGAFPITKYTVLRDSVQYAHLGNVLTYTDTSVPSGIHTYQVRATSAAGNGPLSTAVSITAP